MQNRRYGKRLAALALAGLLAVGMPTEATGGEIEPDVIVTDGEKILEKGTDYTVSYADNKKAGKATVTVKGKGNYTGSKKEGEASKTVSAKPVPAKAALSSVKNSASKTATVKWEKVSGASGYEIYRATSKNGKYQKVTTVKKGGTTSYKNTKLKKGKTYYYKVRAYRTVNGKKVYGAYSEVKA